MDAQNSVGSGRGGRGGLAGLSGGIRSRFTNYADALRSVMQQVIEAGGSISGLDADHIDLEDAPAYREILPMDDTQDELYEEDVDDEENEDECDDDFPPPRGVPVEALASAAAALRYGVIFRLIQRISRLTSRSR